MNCAICGKKIDRIHCHEYFVGQPPPRERPADWVIAAPLYFKASPDGRSMAVPFCSAQCASWRSFCLAYVKANPLPEGTV